MNLQDLECDNEVEVAMRRTVNKAGLCMCRQYGIFPKKKKCPLCEHEPDETTVNTKQVLSTVNSLTHVRSASRLPSLDSIPERGAIGACSTQTHNRRSTANAETGHAQSRPEVGIPNRHLGLQTESTKHGDAYKQPSSQPSFETLLRNRVIPTLIPAHEYLQKYYPHSDRESQAPIFTPLADYNDIHNARAERSVGCLVDEFAHKCQAVEHRRRQM